jgi:hypothetical protein
LSRICRKIGHHERSTSDSMAFHFSSSISKAIVWKELVRKKERERERRNKRFFSFFQVYLSTSNPVFCRDTFGI